MPVGMGADGDHQVKRHVLEFIHCFERFPEMSTPASAITWTARGFPFPSSMYIFTNLCI